jgi:SAM-dependent methyltransferase
MLYHITCLDDALSEIRRVLKPGGVLYATTVGGGHMRELGDLVEEFAGSPEQWEDTVPDQFLVEDGSQWLSKWFSGVELRHYEDSLEITEAGPLVAYVLSVVGDAALSGSDLARFTHFVEQRLVEVGSIRVTKETGLLEATKGQR